MLGWLNAIFFAGMVLVNALADLLPIAQIKTKTVAQQYQHLLSPANYTFMIWGLIYVLIAGLAWYQIKHRDIAKKCGAWFIISCVSNALWIVLWHYQQLWLTLICMAMLTASLFIMQEKLKNEDDSFAQRLFVQGGMGLYFGWALVALVINVAVCLVRGGVRPFTVGAQLWAVGAVLGMTLLATYFLQKYGNIFFGLAVIWGLTGILLEHFMVYRMRYALPLSACAIMTLFLLVRLWQILPPMETRRILE